MHNRDSKKSCTLLAVPLGTPLGTSNKDLLSYQDFKAEAAKKGIALHQERRRIKMHTKSGETNLAVDEKGMAHAELLTRFICDNRKGAWKGLHTHLTFGVTAKDYVAVEKRIKKNRKVEPRYQDDYAIPLGTRISSIDDLEEFKCKEYLADYAKKNNPLKEEKRYIKDSLRRNHTQQVLVDSKGNVLAEKISYEAYAKRKTKMKQTGLDILTFGLTNSDYLVKKPSKKNKKPQPTKIKKPKKIKLAAAVPVSDSATASTQERSKHSLKFTYLAVPLGTPITFDFTKLLTYEEYKREKESQGVALREENSYLEINRFSKNQPVAVDDKGTVHAEIVLGSTCKERARGVWKNTRNYLTYSANADNYKIQSGKVKLGIKVKLNANKKSQSTETKKPEEIKLATEATIPSSPPPPMPVFDTVSSPTSPLPMELLMPLNVSIPASPLPMAAPEQQSTSTLSSTASMLQQFASLPGKSLGSVIENFPFDDGIFPDDSDKDALSLPPLSPPPVNDSQTQTQEKELDDNFSFLR